MTRIGRIIVALHRRRAEGLKPVDYIAIALRAKRDAERKLMTKSEFAQAVVNPMFAALKQRQKRLKTQAARDTEQQKLYAALDALDPRNRRAL